MPNILTALEASTVLRCEVTDADMLNLLPVIDSRLRDATGHDWSSDASIHPTAKEAARILLVQMHEDPGQMGSALNTLNLGLKSAIVRLQVEAMKYHFFSGRDGAGAIYLSGAHVGDTVTTVTGLIGATGDQVAAFETVITVEGEIQQVSTSDLSDNWYRAYLVPLEDL